MQHTVSANQLSSLSGAQVLRWSGIAWFTVAAAGQLAFIAFILFFYGVSIIAGDFAAWNNKPLIEGYVAGDLVGNIMFAIHVMFAAVMTLSGLLQLIPFVRSRMPLLHRYSGRIFLIMACTLAIGGLWLTWGRGSHLSVIGANAISLNALLILVCALMTVRFAVHRKIADHQRWAMRLFMVANGVWFMRIAIMSWIVVAQGPVGMNRTMSGPTDIVIVFGCYLIPLALYELYWRAKQSGSEALKVTAACFVLVATGITAIGVFATSAFMWLPYI
ncbi:MAG: DUF2306 domain-containing protein [Pseudomonadota bacterium]